MNSLPLVESLGEIGNPAEVAAGFLDLPYLVLLESATGPAAAGEAHQLARFSFLTADPGIVIRSKGALTEVGEAGTWRLEEGDALGVARTLLQRWAAGPVAGLPPFQGGAAGYIGYDFGSVLERLPASRYDDLDIPDVVLGLYDWVIAWDHRIGTAWLISTGAPAEADAKSRRAADRLAAVRGALPARTVNNDDVFEIRVLTRAELAEEVPTWATT